MDKKQHLTTEAGRPVGDNRNSLTAGERGPVVFEDFLLFEKMARFLHKADPEYGRGVAEGLGLNLENFVGRELTTAGR